MLHESWLRRHFCSHHCPYHHRLVSILMVEDWSLTATVFLLDVCEEVWELVLWLRLVIHMVIVVGVGSERLCMF